MDISSFWKDVLVQNRSALPTYFCEDAIIRWHCTNEQFTVSEYVRANCDYPGSWDGKIERIEMKDNMVITVVRVYPTDKSAFFHVVSFIKLRNGFICEMDEYWSDDGEAPLWRREMHIGKPVR